jgi:putative membrane protein
MSIGRLVIRWVIIVAALILAVWIVPGIRIEGTNAWAAVAIMALLLGLVNAVLRPLLRLLSCGLILLTLGVFLLVINALTLWLASYMAVNWFGVGFVVDGFWSAFFGGIIVSVISFLLSLGIKE